EYDANGNQTNKTNIITNNSTLYTYDAENRLTKVEEFAAGNPTPASTSTYRYDGLGRRIQKTLSTQSSALSTAYVYDGEDILLEYDGANVLQARYTHGPGIDEPIAVTKGGATFFYHQDALGTVTDLTDSAGATAKSYSYDAYGNLVESPGTLEQPYTYTGREFDSETGLYYYRARAYDPRIGRFLQIDPIGFAEGSINLYLYTNDNPVDFSDPFGLEGCKGTWKLVGFKPKASFSNLIGIKKCECTWICIPCGGSAIWSGNPNSPDLPKSDGQVFFDPSFDSGQSFKGGRAGAGGGGSGRGGRGGGGPLGGGNACLCDKPGPETTCFGCGGLE
ncbi:MAG: hypothetical protein OEV08_16145, partial [Nitrospira sp.]|nr:hypothetical protein [Nitrospira sp.]